MLYHRWRVNGRKETPLPFIIANKLDDATGHLAEMDLPGSNPITIIGMRTRYNAAVPNAEGGWTGGRLHSSEYGCRYMLELGKPRSNYQAQAGDEET